MAYDYDWTIMLYLSGDNSLSEEMVRALADIQLQSKEFLPKGPLERVAFTIQYDPRSSGFPTSRYALAQKKLKLTKRARKQDRLGLLPIPDFLVDTLPGEDSADPRALTSFVKWSSRKFPSRWRMLILSGHGSGAMGDFLPDDDARTGQPDSLTIPRLANALKKAKADIAKWNEGRALLKSGGESRLVHVLGMDSCLMGMAEVGHQVKDEVEFLVGSEGFVPNAGWPYARLLMALKKNGPDRPPEQMARDTVKDVVNYYHQYVPAGVSFDMSACRLDELPKVAKAVKRLVAKLNARMGNAHVRDIVIAAHWHCQSYKFEQHSDLWDFCDQLDKGLRRSRLSGRKVIQTACMKAKTAVAAAIQNRKGYCGAEFQHSHGLSVYFPWSRSPFEEKALAHYVRLTFPRATGSDWSSFLAEYVDKTRRPERRKPSSNSLLVSRFLRQSPYGPGRRPREPTGPPREPTEPPKAPTEPPRAPTG